MVKITDPNEKQTPPQNKKSSTNGKVKLSDSLIKEMLKPENKQDTTPINIRLETSIANQIEQYANEHDTTKTEVIKEVLIEHYSNKMITKGTFKLKEPVTLIIPRSKELLTQYMEHEINLVSTVNNYTGGKNTINPLDPQVALFNTKEGFTLETLTEANNILDMYNPEEKYYHFTIGLEYKKEMAEEIGYFIDNGFLNESELDNFPYIYHRGLMYVNLKQDNNFYEALLIDVLCIGNELVRAVIVDTLRAIELARITNNRELISFLHDTDTYINISDMVQYDQSNKELHEENRNLKEEIKQLKYDYDNLKLEHSSILESLRSDFDNKQDNDVLSYTEALEVQNKKLQSKINEYEEKELEYRKLLAKLKDVLHFTSDIE